MMELKKLKVNNYKSLVSFELNEPNALTVFAGPNGAGKSNIFEAIEFHVNSQSLSILKVEDLFGGRSQFVNFKVSRQQYKIIFDFINLRNAIGFLDDSGQRSVGAWNSQGLISHAFTGKREENLEHDLDIETKFYRNHLRLFINNNKLNRIKYTSNERLLPDASNLESVLKRLLKDESIKEEFLEWLDLLIPGFSNIEIHSDNIGGTDTLLIYEEGTTKPFTKNLISDGTYNILALLTAVYQTNEPQFLCIEEPENGLHPYVIETLVEFFRRQCEEKGHVIWLNTHSQTLVKALKPEELVLVEKKNGETTIKQFSKDYQLYSFDMDTAWLSNVLGGGLPW